jgi:hypothetical protein
MNFIRFAAVGAVAMVMSAALPAVAGATDYCVDTSCGGTQAASLDEALDLADDADDADRVFLGAKIYTPQGSSFKYFATGRVEIIGQGAGRTILTGGSDTVLELLAGSGSSVHDLTVRLPQNAPAQMLGVRTNSLLQRISVVEDPVQVNDNHDGVQLLFGGMLADSTVQLGTDRPTVAAVLGSRFGGADGGNTIRDSTLSAETGVASVQGGATVERSRVAGFRYGVRAYADLTMLKDSLIRSTGPYGTAISAATYSGGDTNMIVDGVTAVTPSTPDTTGVAVSTLPAPAQSVHLTLANSIVRGPFTPLFALASGTGSATISAAYSDYAPWDNVAIGGTINESNVTNVGDALFDETPGSEFRLLPGSPLIDMGDPAAPQGLDLGGGARVTDGNGDGVARRDIGAFELQPSMAGPPSGGGSSGGPAADTPGVEDPGADTSAPLVTGFRFTRSAFAVARAATPRASRVARGTRLRYTLSENARAVIRIQRKPIRPRARYRAVGTLTRTGVSGGNRIRFTGRIGRRALSPGRYRAVFKATDAAGNHSAPKLASFRVLR